MPIYTYACESCGVQFERMQKFADKPLTRCPECRTGKVKRVLQPPSIVFKGSGWYATDHRSPSGQGGSRPADDSKSEGGEKKPAKKDKDKKSDDA